MTKDMMNYTMLGTTNILIKVEDRHINIGNPSDSYRYLIGIAISHLNQDKYQ